MSAKSLEEQVALVTGAAKRIGRSIALELASEGVAVVVNYRHSQTEADETVSDIRSAGGRAIAVQADVSNGGQVAALIGTVEKEFGRLDILVNNAGMFAAAPFDQMTEQQWDEMLSVNLKSQFLCAQAAAKLMKRQGKGRIINISSIGGLLAWPKYAHYCVSKAGVIMLTRCLARALAPEITVNSVAPGTIQFEGELPDEDYIRRTPLRKTGRGNDIAEAVLFLAKSNFITGQVLVVDGGRTLT
jgi:3-oxoacyl-[acyl-carrier protein] reductase/pteridine reductase